MSPLQAAQQHCDNFQDGTCLGITIRDGDYSLVRFLKEGTKCLLAAPCRRCRHFEDAILPMEKRAPSDWKTPLMGQQFREAAQTYRLQSGALSQAQRVCPRCNSRELELRHRFCYICAREVRLEKNRARVRQYRNAVGDPPPAESGPA